jgi:hypothetical protein
LIGGVNGWSWRLWPVLAALTVLAWRVMLPFWGLVAAVALYMRFFTAKRQSLVRERIENPTAYNLPLLQTGSYTTLRFSFAFSGDFECNDDLAPINEP